VIPQKFSQLGPSVAEGDMNGDGLVDFFIGGAANQSGQCFIQQKNGTYINKSLTINKPGEDLGTLLFDSDGDKDLDLLITGGSSEFSQNVARLYKNDGKGNFTLDANSLPQGISQVVINADYDGDGDQDLFIGGRVSPTKYPDFPRSYILQNDKGTFKDVTKEVCPALQTPDC
jgi:enediyne biosynthesis protein E4